MKGNSLNAKDAGVAGDKIRFVLPIRVAFTVAKLSWMRQAEKFPWSHEMLWAPLPVFQSKLGSWAGGIQ